MKSGEQICDYLKKEIDRINKGYEEKSDEVYDSDWRYIAPFMCDLIEWIKEDAVDDQKL